MPSGSTSWFVDTNVLIYAIDPRDSAKKARANWWMDHLIENGDVVLSPQSLNECYRAIRKIFPGLPREDARAMVRPLSTWCVAPLDTLTTGLAWSIEDQTGFQWFDCLLLASAVQAGCAAFLSEDLSHGRAIGPLTIVDPFRLTPAAFSTRP